MSNTPILDKTYLSRVLNLRKTQIISAVEVCQVTESNTALVIKFKIQIQEAGHGISVRRFFIKTIKYNSETNTYHDLSLDEVEFYKLINNKSNLDLPLAYCYDSYISEDKLKFLILLDDVSDEFHAVSKNDLDLERIWISAAKSLAKFHAVFWNSELIGSEVLPYESMDKINYYIKNTKEKYNKFTKYIGNRFDKGIFDIFEHAIEISSALHIEKHKRLLSKNNVTVIHGDSHVHNFMFSSNSSKLPLIIDFQFWGMGIAVGDVAHLTRASYPFFTNSEVHHSIIEGYYETLLAKGVHGYSWDNCWNDYRKLVACMVLIPMWQYVAFGIEYDTWKNDIPRLIGNYKALQCNKL